MWNLWLHYLFFAPHRISEFLQKRICLLLPPTYLNVLFRSHASHILLRQHFSLNAWDSTGISTCCPSLTPFGLGLGPDLPWVDEPSPGTLWLSTGEILTHLLATHASILSRLRSTTGYPLCFDAQSMLLYRWSRQKVFDEYALSPLWNWSWYRNNLIPFGSLFCRISCLLKFDSLCAISLFNLQAFFVFIQYFLSRSIP